MRALATDHADHRRNVDGFGPVALSACAKNGTKERMVTDAKRLSMMESDSARLGLWH